MRTRGGAPPRPPQHPQHPPGNNNNKPSERELAAVKVDAADVDVIVAEAEVDRRLAERRLREHGGVLTEALKSFL